MKDISAETIGWWVVIILVAFSCNFENDNRKQIENHYHGCKEGYDD